MPQPFGRKIVPADRLELVVANVGGEFYAIDVKHPFLPVSHFRPPAAGEASKQTAVFIATRALKDEELFLDYKLREDGPLEAWYSPVERSK